MTEQMKKCPFCGYSVKIVKLMCYMFICPQCGADVTFFGSEDNEKAIIKAWNKRYDADSKTNKVCSTCINYDSEDDSCWGFREPETVPVNGYCYRWEKKLK